MSPPRVADDRDAAIRRGSQSFALASRLFVPATRTLVWDLYTWCRHCDDAVDGQRFGLVRVPVDASAALAEIRRDSEAVLAGDRPAGAPYAALARVLAATDLPAALPRAHLDGFAMDVEGRRFDTLDDTLEYCFHVAGVVGLMMAWVLGARRDDALERGCDLGMAFQLTNIARDVGDDLAHGRVYLPAQWLRRAGASLQVGRPLTGDTAARLVPVVGALLDEADRYYASAWHGLGALPPRSAWAVATARRVYRDIGRVVRRRRARAWQQRATTGRARKLWRTVQATGDVIRTRSGGAGVPRPGLWTPPLARLVR
ncbi:MAG: phytoene/squalene synthase family protein [Vicinamibacterales bacterium]